MSIYTRGAIVATDEHPKWVVVFNDLDMPDTWLEFYRSMYPEAEFQRSSLIPQGTAYVLNPSLIYYDPEHSYDFFAPELDGDEPKITWRGRLFRGD